MKESVGRAPSPARRLRVAAGILGAAVLAGVALRASGSGGTPLWLGRTRGQWAGQLVVSGLIALALAGFDWWVDRRAARSRARALGREA